MTRAPFLLLALLLVPGCLDAAATPFGARDVRVVLVDGAYARAEPEVGICGYDSPPEVDERNGTILFRNDAPPASTRALVLAIVAERVGCGTIATRWAALDEAVGVAPIDLPGLGVVRVRFQEDGTVLVDGQPLGPGGTTVEAEGDGWNATARFRDAGAWDARGLSRA